MGFEDLQQGVGLDVVSSAAAGSSRTVPSPTGSGPDVTVDDSRFDPSLDVFYKLDAESDWFTDSQYRFLRH